MTLTLEIPESLAASIGDQPSSAARAVLEGFALESYRDGRLSAFQVRQLLGHDSRWETEEFLAAHGAWPGLTSEDLARELDVLKQISPA